MTKDDVIYGILDALRGSHNKILRDLWHKISIGALTKDYMLYGKVDMPITCIRYSP